MAAHFWRLKSMQHWQDDVRRMVGGRLARGVVDSRLHLAEGRNAGRGAGRRRTRSLSGRLARSRAPRDRAQSVHGAGFRADSHAASAGEPAPRDGGGLAERERRAARPHDRRVGFRAGAFRRVRRRCAHLEIQAQRAGHAADRPPGGDALRRCDPGLVAGAASRPVRPDHARSRARRRGGGTDRRPLRRAGPRIWTGLNEYERAALRLRTATKRRSAGRHAHAKARA